MGYISGDGLVRLKEEKRAIKHVEVLVDSTWIEFTLKKYKVLI